MSRSIKRLQALGEKRLTTRQLEKAKRLAKQGHIADYIASIIGVDVALVEPVVTAANEPRGVDPQLVWAKDRQSMELSEPTKELFVELFAARNRERIILEATNLVRKWVCEHIAEHKAARWKFDDLESVSIIAVIEETDRLLAKPINHTNPGSMLIDAIRGAIFDPPKDHLSTPHIIVRPRGKPAKHKRVESPMPRGEKIRAKNKMFTGEREDWGPGETIAGQYHNGKPIPAESYSRRDDDDCAEQWEELSELCDEQEMLLLDMLAQGYTEYEAAQEMNINVSTVTKRLSKIREKVQRQRERDGDV